MTRFAFLVALAMTHAVAQESVERLVLTPVR